MWKIQQDSQLAISNRGSVILGIQRYGSSPIGETFLPKRFHCFSRTWIGLSEVLLTICVHRARVLLWGRRLKPCQTQVKLVGGLTNITIICAVTRKNRNNIYLFVSCQIRNHFHALLYNLHKTNIHRHSQVFYSSVCPSFPSSTRLSAHPFLSSVDQSIRPSINLSIHIYPSIHLICRKLHRATGESSRQQKMVGSRHCKSCWGSHGWI